MLARDAVRYALAFIKKFGSSNKIQYFLPLVFNSTQARQEGWSKEHFDELYEQFTAQQARQPRQNNTQNFQANYNPNHQANREQQQNIHIENKRWDFWDCLLLQCWLNSLFGRHNHTTVTHTHIHQGNNGTKKTKDDDDGRKLLAAGIVVVVAIFHISICYQYHSSKKTARKSEKIDYLDNKLKTLRNIEFLGAFVSLAGLIACVVYPVLPVWGLVALGVHSLVCFMGGLAFHMKHEREADDIELAKSTVASYLNPTPAPNPGFNPTAFTDNNPRPEPSAPDPNDFSYYGPPPPYSGPDPNFPNSQFGGVYVAGGQQPGK